MIYLKKICFALCLLYLCTSCTRPNFPLRARLNYYSMRLFDRETSNKVNMKMDKILQNAKAGNLDYFRPMVERVLHERWREDYEWWQEHLHRQLPMPTDEEITLFTEGLMTLIANAEIHNRYRRRMGQIDNQILVGYFYRTPRMRSGFWLMRGGFGLWLLLDDDGSVKLDTFVFWR